MNKREIFIWLFLSSVLFIGNVYAATYYVAIDGDDSNDGSIDEPFRTIQKAANSVNYGDIVIVRDGTYEEAISSSRSGNSESRITYKSENKWGAKIVAPLCDLNQCRAWYNTGRYVDIIGFDITFVPEGKTASSIQIGILDSGSYVRIINNTVHDFKGDGINDALNYDHHSVDIIGNVVYNVGNIETGKEHGIYRATGNGKIVNNLIYNVVGGYCLHLYHAATDVYIAHNTIANCGSDGMGGGVVIAANDGSADNILFENNIVTNSYRYGVREMSNIGSNNYRNNIIYGIDGVNFYLINGNTDQDTITSDPEFIDSDNGDFHLMEGSPAIDSGAISQINDDIDGITRPYGSGYDIGAYEYISGSAQECGNGICESSENWNNCPQDCEEDDENPSIVITNPSNDEEVSEIVEINVDASDNLGVAEVRFYVDDELIGQDDNQPYSYNWNSRNVGNGTHTIKAEALDSAGNIGEDSVIISVQNEPYEEEDGLVAYWKFDENSGDTIGDSSGNGNSGSISGASWSLGKKDGGLQFDGNDDYVIIEDMESPSNEFTISVWIKLNELDREQHIAEFTGSQFFIRDSDNKLAVGHSREQSPFGMTSLITDIWYHVVWIYNGDGNGWMIYLNGEVDASNDYETINPLSEFIIGDLYTRTGDYNYNGLVDEIRVYNRSLNADEVYELYSGGTPENPYDLNLDGRVDMEDVMKLVERWGQNYQDYDFNSDDTVNLLDLMIIVNNWG